MIKTIMPKITTLAITIIIVVIGEEELVSSEEEAEVEAEAEAEAESELSFPIIDERETGFLLSFVVTFTYSSPPAKFWMFATKSYFFSGVTSGFSKLKVIVLVFSSIMGSELKLCFS